MASGLTVIEYLPLVYPTVGMHGYSLLSFSRHSASCLWCTACVACCWCNLLPELHDRCLFLLLCIPCWVEEASKQDKSHSSAHFCVWCLQGRWVLMITSPLSARGSGWSINLNCQRKGCAALELPLLGFGDLISNLKKWLNLNSLFWREGLHTWTTCLLLER